MGRLMQASGFTREVFPAKPPSFSIEELQRHVASVITWVRSDVPGNEGILFLDAEALYRTAVEPGGFRAHVNLAASDWVGKLGPIVGDALLCSEEEAGYVVHTAPPHREEAFQISEGAFDKATIGIDPGGPDRAVMHEDWERVPGVEKELD